jgi:hypothetical protein
MPWYSILFFVLGVLYLVAAFIEIPFSMKAIQKRVL